VGARNCSKNRLRGKRYVFATELPRAEEVPGGGGKPFSGERSRSAKGGKLASTREGNCQNTWGEKQPAGDKEVGRREKISGLRGGKHVGSEKETVRRAEE